jgi:MSHA biogenesis protein MshQ
VPTATPTATPVQTAGLTGAYFNNVTLSGAPVLQRVEAVNYNWLGSPGPGVNADIFSVRWTGRIYAPATGTYAFRTVSDDGVRLWINNTRRINNWTDHAATTDTSSGFTLQGGQWHTVKLEFYDRMENAVIQLLWRLPGTTQYVVIPVTQFSPQ